MARETGTTDNELGSTVQTESPPPEQARPTGRTRRDGSSSTRAKDQQSKAKSKAAKPPLTPELIAAATAGWERILTMAFIGAGMFAPEPFAPTQQEAEGIKAPLSRILGRHYPLPEISGDSEDAFALAIAAGSYGARVFSQLTSQAAPQPEPPPTPFRRPAYTEPAPAVHEEARRAHEDLASAGVPQPGEARAASPGEGMAMDPSDLAGPPDAVLERIYESTLNGPMVQGS